MRGLALKAIKRSPLGLDLYLWLTYRTFNLKTPLCLSWRQLYRQFGADPARVTAGRVFDASRFRAVCLRELKKINRAWPDLHYHTVTGGLVIEPSPPCIPRHSSVSSTNRPERSEVAPREAFGLGGGVVLSCRRAKAAPGATQRRGRAFSTKACESDSERG